MIEISYALWCGFWWRVRGGAWETLLHLPPKGQLARITCCTMIALPMAFVNVEALSLAVLLFLGVCMVGWGDWFNIPEAPVKNTVMMSLCGLGVMAPSIVFTPWFGWPMWYMVVAGLFFGPAYAACWYAPKLPSTPGFANGPTEWAEVLVGAGIGLGYWASVT